MMNLTARGGLHGMREKSPQRLVNEALADLHVICLGVDGNTLVLKRTRPTDEAPPETLKKVADRLFKSEPIRLAMQGHITGFKLV